MSKLDELIEKLCPDGVKFEKLGNEKLFKFYYGKGNKIPEDVGGVYDVYGANGVVSHINEYNCEDVSIIGHIGAVGMVNRCKGKCFVTYNGTIAEIVDKSKINTQYFYYVLTKLDLPSYKKGNQPFLSVSDFDKIRIPVPPLEVQREIVHILDDFTLLSAELSAELKARQKQYEYYSEKLLKFENAKYHSLEDICEIVDYRGKTPRKTNEGIFLITAKNIRKGYIDYEKSQEFISECDYKGVMHRGLPKIGDVLITTEAPCGNVAQIDRENVALAQRVIKYRSKDSKLNNTFLKYILLGKEFQDKLSKNFTGGTVKGIKGSVLHKLTIPLPPREEQERIVNILDKFEKLCNDISEGLPAEIEARKKQYEYYRDKLLTFKELKVKE